MGVTLDRTRSGERLSRCRMLGWVVYAEACDARLVVLSVSVEIAFQVLVEGRDRW